MDEKMQKYLLYGLMVIVVVGAAWAASGLFMGSAQNEHSAARFERLEGAKQASGATGQVDPCAPPEGVSEEEWKRHMGHHPDQYAECL